MNIWEAAKERERTIHEMMAQLPGDDEASKRKFCEGVYDVTAKQLKKEAKR